MSKHSIPTILPTRNKKGPAHSKGWTKADSLWDQLMTGEPYAPGRHAKPFGKHTLVGPVAYDHRGNVTPMAPVEHALDVAA